MPFVKGKPYQTRNGLHARFLETQGAFSHWQIQLSGMTDPKRGWYRALRNADGSYTNEPSDHDIIPITASDEELAIMQRMARSDHDELILLIRELTRR